MHSRYDNGKEANGGLNRLWRHYVPLGDPGFKPGMGAVFVGVDDSSNY